mgnify:FL=1
MNAGATAVVEFDPARDNDLVIRTNGSRKQFRFDRVFTPSNNQCKQIYHRKQFRFDCDFTHSNNQFKLIYHV